MSSIVIDLVLGVLILKTPFIEKTYPVVTPRNNALYQYEGKREFTVKQIGLDVGWVNAEGTIIPASSPRNPLGKGRIRFKNATNAKYSRPCSIHGAAREQDLRKQLSGCCIRMRDEDLVEIVFEITYDTEIVLEGR